MIIPAKSTIEEEDIKIPFAQDKRESGSTTMDERSTENFREVGNGFVDGEPDSASDYPASPLSPRSPAVGLGGLAARLRNAEEDEDDGNASSGHGGMKSGGEEYYGRSSVNSDRGLGSRQVGRGSISDDSEKLKREYEYKIATTQGQVANLTKELAEVHEDRDRRRKEDEARLQAKEEELGGVRSVSFFFTPQRN